VGDVLRKTAERVLARAEAAAVSSEPGDPFLRKQMQACGATVLSVDGFTSTELCLHFVVTARADTEAVLAAVKQLGIEEVLPLLTYLLKWEQLYAERLTHSAPSLIKGKVLAVPHPEQIAHWLGHVLDAHCTRLSLLPASHQVVMSIKQAVATHALVCRKLLPLVGCTRHLEQKRVIPTYKGTVSNHYSIQKLAL
ncbi:hypothetical protein CYMTET_27773, partial [Cymbomonas tetramitiformis]